MSTRYPGLLQQAATDHAAASKFVAKATGRLPLVAQRHDPAALARLAGAAVDDLAEAVGGTLDDGARATEVRPVARAVDPGVVNLVLRRMASRRDRHRHHERREALLMQPTAPVPGDRGDAACRRRLDGWHA